MICRGTSCSCETSKLTFIEINFLKGDGTVLRAAASRPTHGSACSNRAISYKIHRILCFKINIQKVC